MRYRLLQAQRPFRNVFSRGAVNQAFGITYSVPDSPTLAVVRGLNASAGLVNVVMFSMNSTTLDGEGA